MILLAKVISTELDKMKKRLVKLLAFGKYDVRTPIEASPWGIDSNPVKDTIAVFSETATKGDMTVVGYLVKDKKAKPGETRIFATDKNGVLKSYIWMLDDGTMEIAGNGYHLTRQEPLDQGLQDFKVQLQAELAAIASGITVAGGSYTPGILSVDIAAAKIEELKCI